MSNVPVNKVIIYLVDELAVGFSGYYFCLGSISLPSIIRQLRK